MLRCTECNTDFIINSTKHQNWMKLYNFIDFMYSEEYITQATYNDMINCLLTFSKFSNEIEND